MNPCFRDKKGSGNNRKGGEKGRKEGEKEGGREETLQK